MDKVIIIQSQKRLYTLDEEWFTEWKPNKEKHFGA